MAIREGKRRPHNNKALKNWYLWGLNSLPVLFPCLAPSPDARTQMQPTVLVYTKQKSKQKTIAILSIYWPAGVQWTPHLTHLTLGTQVLEPF